MMSVEKKKQTLFSQNQFFAELLGYYYYNAYIFFNTPPVHYNCGLNATINRCNNTSSQQNEKHTFQIVHCQLFGVAIFFFLLFKKIIIYLQLTYNLYSNLNAQCTQNAKKKTYGTSTTTLPFFPPFFLQCGHCSRFL